MHNGHNRDIDFADRFNSVLAGQSACDGFRLVSDNVRELADSRFWSILDSNTQYTHIGNQNRWLENASRKKAASCVLVIYANVLEWQI